MSISSNWVSSTNMSEFTIYKFLQWSPLIQVLILVIGTLLSFSIALARGDVNFYMPFISETGAYSPEMCVFSMFLILGSFIGAIMIFFRFLVMMQTAQRENLLFWKLNCISCCIGVLAMLGLAGVAAFPMTTVLWAHLLFAGMYFVGMAVYISFVTFLTFSLEGSSKLLKFRFGLSICIFILLFFLVICFPIAHKRWHELNKIIPALKVPQDQGFTLMLISSLLEWSVVLIIVLFTLTLIAELKKHNLILMISSNKQIEDVVVQECPSAESNPQIHSEMKT